MGVKEAGRILEKDLQGVATRGVFDRKLPFIVPTHFYEILHILYIDAHASLVNDLTYKR